MKKLPPILTYLLIAFVSGFSNRLVFTTSAIYRVQSVGLNPLQLVLVGTTLEVTAFVFEIPTGVVADITSRRLSVIIGVFLIGVGFAVEGLAPLFWLVLLSQVLWGLGFTFVSGALSAWITDEIGVERATPVFLRRTRLSLVGNLLALPFTLMLARQSLAAPFLVGGLLRILLAAALALWMPETGFHPVPKEERQGWGDVWTTAGDGFRQMRRHPVLRSYLLIGLLLGLYSEGWDRLRDFHLLDQFVFPDLFGVSMGSVEWFVFLSACSQVLGIAAAWIAQRQVNRPDRVSLTGMLQGLHALMVVCMAGFALTGNFLAAVFALLMFDTFRSVTFPLLDAWLNRHIRSETRATVLSMTSQLDALGQMSGGPLIGMIGRIFSVRAAIVTAAGILSPTVWLFRKAGKLSRKENILVDTGDA
jgi:DHA3 family tetracycline resistance protein-like MFS transporter